VSSVSALFRLFTPPPAQSVGTRERAGMTTSPYAASLPVPAGKANPSAGVEQVTSTVGAVPYPRSDDPETPIRVVQGRTIAGCPEEHLDTWFAGTGTLTGVYADLPPKLAVTDNVDRRVSAVTELDRAGRLAELFKRGK